MVTTQAVVHSDPEIMGGTPVFVGTRVPVDALFDYLEAGDRLNRFLRHFPSVRREQAVAALKMARQALRDDACARLLDESVPRPLRRALGGHEVQTVRQVGWSGTRNGELLRRPRRPATRRW